MALTAAEYFAVEKNEKVLVLLTDMTLYADALAIVSNRMDQIPSKDNMPGSLYSDLAKIYEKAVQFPDGGSITIIAVTTLSEGDITHAIPDNTGYITEGQLFLRRDTEIGKVIVDPFRSLSRLKQLVIARQTRNDHAQVMNSAIGFMPMLQMQEPSWKTVLNCQTTMKGLLALQRNIRKNFWQ